MMSNLFNISDIGLGGGCYISEDKDTVKLNFSVGNIHKGRNLSQTLKHFSKCDRFFRTKIIYCENGSWFVEVLMAPKIADSYEVKTSICSFLNTTQNSFIEFEFQNRRYYLDSKTFEEFCESPEIDREIKIKRWLDKFWRRADLISIPRFLKKEKAKVTIDHNSEYNFRSIGTRSDRYIEVLTACVEFTTTKKVELYHDITPAKLEKLEKSGMIFNPKNEYYIKANNVIKLAGLGD